MYERTAEQKEKRRLYEARRMQDEDYRNKKKLRDRRYDSRPDIIEKKRRTYLYKTYRITEEIYQEMVLLQGGMCDICKTAPNRLVVDHCHTTGKVRGLLCNRCNLKLGWYKDEMILSSAKYLVKHGARR